MQLAKCVMWNVEGQRRKSVLRRGKGPRIPNLNHIVGRQLLDHERKQNGPANNDGRVGRGDCQQRDGTDTRITIVDEHVRQRSGRTIGYRKDCESSRCFSSCKEVDLVGNRYQRSGKYEAGIKNTLKKSMNS